MHPTQHTHTHTTHTRHNAPYITHTHTTHTRQETMDPTQHFNSHIHTHTYEHIHTHTHTHTDRGRVYTLVHILPFGNSLHLVYIHTMNILLGPDIQGPYTSEIENVGEGSTIRFNRTMLGMNR